MIKLVQSSEFIVRRILLILLLTINYELLTMNCLFAAGFELGEVKPKIITPNDDNKNDIFIISCGEIEFVSGRILTINGSYIKDMPVNYSDPYDVKITWDGKNDGSAVPSGIYIYQIEAEGQVFNGTVVVAK
ncbi:MAG: gliding motility-associated C-terminal domain-containing protein [Elusimicrobia bacterium]|nr:gliding motility-associated C-terminal domain-containing protein [Elusimicrobiota bacterium]